MQQERQPYIRGFLIIIVSWWIAGAIISTLSVLILPDTLMGNYLALNSSFLPFLASLIFVVRSLFAASWEDFISFGSRRDIRPYLTAGIAWFILFTISTYLEFRISPERFFRNSDIQEWFRFLPVLLLITPLQTGCEELFFRAYLCHWMKQAKAHNLVIIILSGLIFLAVHLLNPEISRYGDDIWIYLYYLIFGSGMMAIALADGSFILPIIIHTVNNLFSIAIVNYEGTVMAAPSLFLDSGPDPMISCITLAFGIIATLLVLRSRIDRNVTIP